MRVKAGPVLGSPHSSPPPVSFSWGSPRPETTPSWSELMGGGGRHRKRQQEEGKEARPGDKLESEARLAVQPEAAGGPLWTLAQARPVL